MREARFQVPPTIFTESAGSGGDPVAESIQNGSFRGLVEESCGKWSMGRIAQSDLRFMEAAIELAKRAAAEGETPVGAVLVREGAIIGKGYNRVEADRDPTAHAEMIALRQAARSGADWRLSGATLYVTVEPCIMCASALLLARVGRLVFGAPDPRWGGVGSVFDLSHDPRINRDIEVIPGVMAEQAAELLQSFFRMLRRDAREVEGG